jgi:hypothetical protein
VGKLSACGERGVLAVVSGGRRGFQGLGVSSRGEHSRRTGEGLAEGGAALGLGPSGPRRTPPRDGG